MKPFENPIVLVTRPAQSAVRFIEELTAVAPPFQPVISPAFELEKVEHDVDPFEGAIFTSQAGVEFAPDGEGRMAWCVGQRTAEIAQMRGYKTRVGSGTAEDLSKLILRENPSGRLVHFRGENVRVNVKTILSEGALACSEVVIYKKALRGPSVGVRELSSRAEVCLIPIFSGETVSILASWPLAFERTWIIAISEDVFESAARLSPLGITCADGPDLNNMTRATMRLIA